MNINGVNGLACIKPLSECVKNNKLVLRPLLGLPVIRDLVVDMGQFYEQFRKVEPYLQNDTPAPAIERLQSPRSEERRVGNERRWRGGGDDEKGNSTYRYREVQ